MKHLFYLIIIGLLLTSCNENRSESVPVSSSEDYEIFLAQKKTDTNSPYFELWNSKITIDSIELPSFSAVGGQYAGFFQSTGDISYLKKAEKSFVKATTIANMDKEKYYHSLARNYISQHRFKEAMVYADSANALGSDITATQHLLFDVYMELGKYKKADSIQKVFADPYDFGYIIRAAKWNDYIGKLDNTIEFMEKAKERAESSKNRSLLLWTYSNLGDYYGHAGEIEKSYSHYLKTLAIDSSNAYAKKGLAWIVYANDDKPKEALRIIDSVLDYHISPDFYLLKAEIAEYMNDEPLAKEALKQYWQLVSDPDYGAMYNTYNIELYSQEDSTAQKALQLAHAEVINRATPETYRLMALAHLVNGNNKQALAIIDEKVKGKTFEPTAQLTMAKVYKANGMEDKVKSLKSELMEASYELGPVVSKEVSAL